MIVGDHRKPIHDRNNFSSERRPRSASCHHLVDELGETLNRFCVMLPREHVAGDDCLVQQTGVAQVLEDAPSLVLTESTGPPVISVEVQAL